MTAHSPTVHCNDCGFTALGCTWDTIATLRDHLAYRLGWSVRDGDGELDLCGQCVHRRWPRPELTVTTSTGELESEPILVARLPRRQILR